MPKETGTDVGSRTPEARVDEDTLAWQLRVENEEPGSPSSRSKA